MTYTYICDNGHTSEVIHSMKQDPVITCAACGLIMHRKPQRVAVNWGGPLPSAGGVAPQVQDLLNTRSERLDNYQARKQ